MLEIRSASEVRRERRRTNSTRQPIQIFGGIFKISETHFKMMCTSPSQGTERQELSL